MTTGVWETVDESIADSGDKPVQRMTWAQGTTKRGKPPRRTSARTLRRVLKLMLGWAITGAAVLRIAQLIGGS